MGWIEQNRGPAVRSFEVGTHLEIASEPKTVVLDEAGGSRQIRAAGLSATLSENRQAISASAVELRSHKTLFYTDKTKSLLSDEQIEFFNEVAEPGSGFKEIKVNNFHNFKTPVNLAIAEFENERRFMRGLVDPANVGKYDAWMKSAPVRFYDIVRRLTVGGRAIETEA